MCAKYVHRRQSETRACDNQSEKFLIIRVIHRGGESSRKLQRLQDCVSKKCYYHANEERKLTRLINGYGREEHY